MKVSCIVAVDQHLAIGSRSQIPWYLPADLKYFRKTTTPHHVIMGRQTYESIGKPLPNRINIIITRDPYYLASGCLIAHSIEEALSIADDHGEKESFIIGGAQIYAASEHYWDKVYMTRVHTIADQPDAFFPELNDKIWVKASSTSMKQDEKNKFEYTFEVYTRRIAE